MAEEKDSHIQITTVNSYYYETSRAPEKSSLRVLGLSEFQNIHRDYGKLVYVICHYWRSGDHRSYRVSVSDIAIVGFMNYGLTLSPGDPSFNPPSSLSLGHCPFIKTELLDQRDYSIYAGQPEEDSLLYHTGR